MNQKPATASTEYSSIFPQHEAIGMGRGVMPGRVAWAYDPGSVTWEGESNWWEPTNYDETKVRSMVNKAIACVGGGAETAALGWKALFERQGGYAPGQVIAIKCNERYCRIHEAALANNAPSGAEYLDGLGNHLQSLGVHEHWNNATDKQYGRNLGKIEGIELIQI